MDERINVSDRPRNDAPSTSDLVDRLSRFDGPPEAFLANLLAVQCYIATAGGGAILRLGGENKVDVLAVHPPVAAGQTAPVWLAQSVEYVQAVQSSGVTAVRPLRSTEDLYGAPPSRFLILVPLRGGSGVRGAACFLIDTADPATLAVCRERIELTSSLLSLYEMRLTLQRRQLDLGRLRLSMEVLSSLNESDRFANGAMAVCNELSARLQCQRVSLGFLKGRYVHLRAMSHTEKFSRKMKVVQDIESAMEECLDQDVEIVYPASEQASFVSRAAKELSNRHGPSSVLSLPLRRNSEPQGVLTVEREIDRPFTLEEAESLRLACDLCAARLLNLHEHDRWFGARAAAAVRRGAALAVGPKHTWIKLLVIGVAAFLAFALFVKGDYEAEANFLLEAKDQFALPAPFEGKIDFVNVEPGDSVKTGDVLAKLETKELEKPLIDARSDLASALSEESKAMAAMEQDRTKMADVKIAQAKARSARHRIEWLEGRIRDSYIRSPLDGKVVSGDLKKQSHPPVKTGDILFEVASVSSGDSLRAVLDVPEDQIAEVQQRSGGELATMAYPEKRIGFTVERINPVAEVVDQQNIFKVRVLLTPDDVRKFDAANWMAPGMKGVAKIYLGEKTYAEIWTRKMINWIRMKLWI